MLLFLGALVTVFGLSLAVPANVLPTADECGIESSKSSPEGDVAGLRESPWTCLIEYMKPDNKTGIHCSCVLINQQYVLTASSCVTGTDMPTGWRPYRIILGEWDRTTDSDCLDGDCALPVQKILVSKTVPHPQYVPQNKNQHNDIALIRLEAPVTYNDFVQPICLPLEQSLQSKEYGGEVLEVSGWGKKDPNKESYRKLTVPITVAENSACFSYYAKVKVEIGDSQICAGGVDGQKIPCSGDSGAPMVAIDSDSPHKSKYLVGLSSYGPVPCGQMGSPDVFAKVSVFVDWVQKTIEA